MKIGPVEKVLIVLSVLVVMGSFAFAINAMPKPDTVAVLKTLNMTCGSCAGSIEKTLSERPGVDSVSVDVAAAQVVVIYDARQTSSQDLAGAVTAAGYPSGVVRELSLEHYREITGQNGLDKKPLKKSGCGKECC
jgi:copper chaperone CopZ